MVRQLGASSEKTRSAVFDLIRSGGTVSRVQLAERSGLTGASITRVVQSLIAAGLVVETGLGDFTGGKRSTLLEIDATSRFAVGVSLDDEALSYVVVDLGGRVVARSVSAGIGQSEPVAVIRRVASELDSLLGQSGVDRRVVVGVGVAGAGLDLRRGGEGGAGGEGASLTAAEWEEFAVEEALGSASGLPVVRENDAACAAIGQFWTGRVAATQDFVTLYMATGFGCGIIRDGRLDRGASSNVGEIGHVVIDLNGPACWCGSRGCLEMLAAPRQVVQRAMVEPRLADSLGLDGTDARVRSDFAAIARAAARGDEASLALIEDSASCVAAAVLSVVNLLDLDLIYLAGPGFADAGAIYLRAIRKRVEQLARTRRVHGVEVRLTDPALDAAAVGAATLALQQLVMPRARSTAG